MAKIDRFEDLQVWQLAREICRDVWNLIEETSLQKDFELKNQMSLSCGSIMDNIAEGFERNGNREFIQFLSISKGSCGKLKSQLYRSLDKKHISQPQFDILYQKAETESKMLGSFMSCLNSSNNKGSKFSNPKTTTHNSQP
ncbi:four helix bundle protein [Flavobacterium cyanobacteriorum]|uniref:Four helix bundle protein n=1 Tax=Flavobacterium cyanobacteriorum TaxID=2022802 RepID=A0A255Z5A4_9FLAO|nr:four helix bundle protein [Flavobacterium cyanobacteriorum]OYQ36629.1 four helix bundle protein [Flavobacterium cyanobacteriorum]